MWWVSCSLTALHPCSACLLVQLIAAGRKVHIVAPDYGEYARSHKM